MDLLKLAREAVRKDLMDLEFFIKRPDGVIKLFDPDYFFIGKVDKAIQTMKKQLEQ